MIVDLHVCIPESMTDEVIEKVVSACRDAGLDGACLVGIDSVPPVERIRAMAGGLTVFFGVEFTLSRGRLVWIPSDLSAFELDLPFRRTLEETVEFFKSAGGVMFAAHPYDRSDGPAFVDAVYDLDDITGIEVANAGRDPWKNNMAQDAAGQLKLKGFGGTGRHEAGRGEIGSAATLVLDDVTTQADLVEQLRKEDVWALEFLSDASQFGEDGSEETHREQPRSQGGRDQRHPGARPSQNQGQRGPGRPGQGPRGGAQKSQGGGRPQQRGSHRGQGNRSQ